MAPVEPRGPLEGERGKREREESVELKGGKKGKRQYILQTFGERKRNWLFCMKCTV